MRGEQRVLIVALLDLQTEVDLVAHRVGQAHRRQLTPKRAQCGEARFDRRRRSRVVSPVEQFFRTLRLIDDRREAALERIGRVRARKLRDAVQRDVDVVEDRRLVLLHLAGNRRVDERVLSTAATTSAAARESGQRRQPGRSLALVIAVRVGADFRIRPSQ